MAEYLIQDSTLTGIANAIRSKDGSSGVISVSNFSSRINAIDTQENLDSEMTTQDNLVAQITAALDGKMVPEAPKLPIEGFMEADSTVWDGTYGMPISTFTLPNPNKFSYLWLVRIRFSTGYERYMIGVAYRTSSSNNPVLTNTTGTSFRPDGTTNGLMGGGSGPNAEISGNVLSLSQQASWAQNVSGSVSSIESYLIEHKIV